MLRVLNGGELADVCLNVSWRVGLSGTTTIIPLINQCSRCPCCLPCVDYSSQLCSKVKKSLFQISLLNSNSITSRSLQGRHAAHRVSRVHLRSAQPRRAQRHRRPHRRVPARHRAVRDQVMRYRPAVPGQARQRAVSDGGDGAGSRAYRHRRTETPGS